MNEWVLEFLLYINGVDEWVPSEAYGYDSKKGIHNLDGKPPLSVFRKSVEMLNMKYRLRHIPTGKIIPYDLL